ncbi:hypothetical protein HN51_057394 [Arachis hypogaea]
MVLCTSLVQGRLTLQKQCKEVILSILSSIEIFSVPMPIVLIDQDSDTEATIVQLSFGDRHRALIDMVTWLFELYLCSNSQTLQSI